MPGIGGLIATISADVVSRLAAAGYPALTDGAILIGRQWLAAQSAPPRIVFVPIASRFEPRDTYGVDVTTQRAQWLQRAIGSEVVRFEVHVWGAATPPDPNGGDFDAAQVLYQVLYQSLWGNAQGTFTFLDGAWTDQEQGEAQLQKLGHEFVFGLEIGTPILDVLLQFVPHGTTGQVTVEFDGSSTDGAVVITTTPTP